MIVFVTGATGYIGGAVAATLRRQGYRVLGLARSTDAAEKLKGAGIVPLSGALEDAESLRLGVESADAVVHTAFARDAYDNLSQAVAIERRSVDVLVTALGASGKPFVYTSGIGIYGDMGGRVIDHATPIDPPPWMTWRRDLELAVLAGSNGTILRPGLVYGGGGGEIIPALIRSARERGAAIYPGAGDNVLPTIALADLADAFLRAIELGNGPVALNVVGSETTPRAIAGAIGRLIGTPERTRGMAMPEARQSIPYADWLTASMRIDSRHTRETLKWTPSAPGVPHEIEFGSYRLGERART